MHTRKSTILLTRGTYCPSRLSRSAIWVFASLILLLPSAFAQQSPACFPPYNHALLIAAERTDTAAITNALNAGANPNALTPQGLTVLEIAHHAWTELPHDTVDQLIEKRKRLSLVKTLLDRGAALKHGDGLSQQLMFDSLYYRRFDLSLVLLSRGVALKENVGRVMNSSMFSHPLPDLDQRKVFDYWMMHPYEIGADGKVCSKSATLQDALYYAVSAEDAFYFTQSLLARGVDVNTRQWERVGQTPLIAALRAQNPSVQVITLLLQHGANPNTPFVWPRHPYWYLTEDDLLDGKTPLDFAIQSKNQAIIDIIQAAISRHASLQILGSNNCECAGSPAVDVECNSLTRK